MCKLTKNELLREVAVNNNQVITNIKNYLYHELNILFYNNNTSSNNNNLYTKSYYKQVVKRLLNLAERYSMKERILFQEIKKGNELLQYKRAVTVKSPSYDNQSSFNEGYRPNTQIEKLIDIHEEEQKQKQRINTYDLFVKSFNDNKELIKSFIELSPNTKAVEVIIRHYLEGQRFCDIAKEMCYEETYYLAKRGIDELAVIIMQSL